MNEIYRKALYSQAIENWGQNFHFDMLVEECSELIHSICKFKRNVNIDTTSNFIEEIADVEIMIECVKYILKRDELIEKIKEQKLERLKTRILNK